MPLAADMQGRARRTFSGKNWREGVRWPTSCCRSVQRGGRLRFRTLCLGRLRLRPGHRPRASRACRRFGSSSFGASAASRRLLDQRAVAFAVGQPDVVDGWSTACRAGLSANIQPVKMRLTCLAASTSSTSTKASVLRRLGRRPRVAGARRHLQRAELHRLVDGDVERDDAAGDLVEPGEDRGRTLILSAKAGTAASAAEGDAADKGGEGFGQGKLP